ncbi:drug resistance transporter, EmrB/QacA subfamily [Amycolatopsis pretoriensis]|uniref:Drug resistance transporter, EmrB/QacA subfamily n=1 Tax=Amycolatopsis pretoriensis TaxID=218821 RepID=A0A1H5R665_9PSEU|nr:MFS transporter [Amycolatopsis pretoriensis]SEF32887.1 drug resistance transporter, EmrB/QacA subfamily [Amycolatopsis pretoriensis]
MRKWWPLVAVCAGSFLFLLDTTVVTVALPRIGADLSASVEQLQWVPDVYTLVLAVLMLAVGSLADRWGLRRVFLAGVAVFGLASLACGFAGDIGTLIAARGVQAVGGAALAVTGFAVLAACYDGRARGTAISVFFAVNGLGAAAGPVVGGVLTEYFGWAAIFFVNVPPALLTAVLAAVALRPATPARRGRFDVAGAVWFAVFAASLVHGLTSEPVALVVSAVALAGFVIVERRRAEPLLELGFFRDGRFTALVACAAASTLTFAALVYVSLWLSRSHSPVEAGLAMAPLAVASFLTSTFLGKVLHRFPPRVLLGAGVLLGALGCLVLLVAGIRLGLAVTGVGVGIAGPATGAAITAAAPPGRAGMAAGILTTTRQFGQTLGVAVLGIAYQAGGLTPVYVVAAVCGGVTGLLALVPRERAVATG